MRLTKKKAVEITKELWEWCAETGGYKLDWPNWKEYGEFGSYCPLCEYDARHKDTCRECPLADLWTRKLGGHCMHDGSPYKLWLWTFAPSVGEPDIKARTEYAQQIVDLCDRWLKENK